MDTQDKRASACWPLLPFRCLLPIPDAAALDLGDKQQVAFLYRGVAAQAEIPIAHIRTTGHKSNISTGQGVKGLISRGTGVKGYPSA